MYTEPFVQVQIKKTLKLCVTCLCEVNSPVTGEFPAQRASNAENVSIWLRHHVFIFSSHDIWYHNIKQQNVLRFQAHLVLKQMVYNM